MLTVEVFLLTVWMVCVAGLFGEHRVMMGIDAGVGWEGHVDVVVFHSAASLVDEGKMMLLVGDARDLTGWTHSEKKLFLATRDPVPPSSPSVVTGGHMDIILGDVKAIGERIKADKGKWKNAQFVGLSISLRYKEDDAQRALLATLSCAVQATVRMIWTDLGLPTVVTHMEIDFPVKEDVLWTSTAVRAIDDLRGAAPSLFFNGLRGFGFGRGVCEGADLACLATRVEGQPKPVLKGVGISVRGWGASEVQQRRRSTGPAPFFPCGDFAPIRTGAVYMNDKVVSWGSAERPVGWVSVGTAQVDSTEHVFEGTASIKIDSGRTLKLSYVDFFPFAGPLRLDETNQFLFDLFVEDTAPSDLMGVRLTVGGAEPVDVATVASRAFGAGMWQRVLVTLVGPPSTTFSSITLSVPVGQPAVFIDRLTFNTPELPCQFQWPEKPCGPLFVGPPGSSPINPRAPAVCGNGRVERGEDCDGGKCCTSGCTLQPLNTPCRDAVVSDPCDVADVCDGVSGGCRDAKKPVGTACDDDNDRCTSDDRCRSNGVCAGDWTCSCFGDRSVCNPEGNPCVAHRCEKNMCLPINVIDGALCDDNDPCTSADICFAGECRGKATPGLCRPLEATLPDVACEPGQKINCGCDSNGVCVAPLVCDASNACRFTPREAKSCTLAQFGKEVDCPCEPGSWCKEPLMCTADNYCAFPPGRTGRPAPDPASSPVLVVDAGSHLAHMSIGTLLLCSMV